jgi:catechol 2,3-dioxygenase-like lactoylglutathione lyase family enzyme
MHTERKDTTTIKRMHHAGVPVSDLTCSVKWYTEVLGAIDSGVTIAGDASVGALLELDEPSMGAGCGHSAPSSGRRAGQDASRTVGQEPAPGVTSPDSYARTTS